MSNPPNNPEPREPSLKELLRLMHADERQFWESGDGSPQQREEFLEGIKTRWREVTPHRKVPFANPSKEYLRRDRIERAYQSGQRPNPEDLAEEEADRIRYQREVAEAFEKIRKDLLQPEPKPETKPEIKPEPPPSLESEESPKSLPPSLPTSEPSKRPTTSGKHKKRRKKGAQQETILEKLWRLSDSNLFWGGGVGMAIAAYAFLMGGAPRFATVLLVIAWLMMAVSIYRHNFFEGKSKLTQAIGQTLILGLLAVILIVLWFALRPQALQVSQPPPSPAPSVLPSPVFYIRHKGAVVFSDFPQPLLYEYGAPNTFLAPIGLAINVEVVNNRPTKTKIAQYLADIQTPDGHWYRVLNLPMSPPHTIYFLNRREMQSGMKCIFDPAIFDPAADNKNLDPGESLEGWVFFEWPLELRRTTVTAKAIRLTIRNSQNETEQTVFEHDSSIAEEPGASTLDSGGGFCRGKPGEKIDLTNVPIKPLRD